MADPDFTLRPVYAAMKDYTNQIPVMYAGHHQEDHWAVHWGPGGHGEGWSAMSDLKESFGQVMHAIRTTAGDQAKRKEIREVLDEAAKKVGDIAKR